MKIHYLLISALICSCNISTDYQHLPKIEGYTNEILPNGEKIEIDSFHIIPLETTPENLISDITKIEFTDSLIFIQCDNELLCFNNTGKFKYTIGNIGKGPGEFHRVNTFFIHENNKEINIIDEATQRILTYDLSGNFISDKKYPSDAFLLCASASLLKDSTLLCSNFIYNNVNTIYSLLNLHTEKRQSLFNFSVKSANTAEHIGRHPISFYSDTVKFIVPFDNKIYMLSESEIRPWAIVKTEDKLISHKEIKEITDFSIMTYADFMNKGSFTGFTSICETNKYLFLQVLFNLRYFLVKKDTNVGQIYENSIYDDQILELPLLNISMAKDDFFVGIEEASSLKRIANKISKHTTNKNLKYLRETANLLLEDDNPCLLLYKLK